MSFNGYWYDITERADTELGRSPTTSWPPPGFDDDFGKGDAIVCISAVFSHESIMKVEISDEVTLQDGDL